MENKELEKISLELEGIKKLMILDLFEKGYSQSQIALTLGVGQSTVSKMFPKGALLKKNGN